MRAPKEGKFNSKKNVARRASGEKGGSFGSRSKG